MRAHAIPDEVAPTMDDIDLLADLHRGGGRQGPGGDAETRLAITLSGLRGVDDLRIADVGCGTGASTLVLARELAATITAVDVLAAFLADLDRAAADAGLGDRIATLLASMDSLPFEADHLDAIWSEGAIYNMGFATGVEAWRRFLKPGGILAVSELTWLTHRRPAALERHWRQVYPEVATAAAKLAVLEERGYSPLGYFPLPEHCWLNNFYRPLQARFGAFLARHGSSAAARAVVDAENAEIALYERFSAFVGYGYYVAKKTAD